MTLIKLKNANITNLIEDEETFSVFASTYTPDDIQTMKNFTFELNSQYLVETTSLMIGEYSYPIGFESSNSFVLEILTLVNSKENEDMTVGEFFKWFADTFLYKAVKIEVIDKKENMTIKEGYLFEDRLDGSTFLDIYRLEDVVPLHFEDLREFMEENFDNKDFSGFFEYTEVGFKQFCLDSLCK